MKYPNPLTGEMNDLDPENPQPGIYAGVPHDVYLEIKAVSRSLIKDFSEAPEKVLFRDQVRKDHLIFGTQYHAYVFEPTEFKKRFFQGTTTPAGKRGKDFRAEQEIHGFDYVYKPQDLEMMEAMYDALKRYKKSYAILNSNNLKELTIIFRHDASGLMCKIKIDILINEPGWIIDLKTTRDASKEKFSWHIRDYRYDLQSGFYVMGCQATPGLEHVEHFGIVAQEKSPDRGYMVRGINMREYIDAGIVESHSLLISYAEWVAAGRPVPDGLEVMEKYTYK